MQARLAEQALPDASAFEERVRAMFREPQPTNKVLSALPAAEASLIDVGNQPGWYILDTGDESYLLQATKESGELLPLMTATERLEYRYEPADRTSCENANNQGV